ncbi:MAG: Lrp/AsnC ligand binding domain-containing protein [Acidimicrobiales bacterium]
MQAYVLIQTDLGRVGEVIELVRKLPGIVRADTVTGPYDIIALLEQDNLEDLGREVVDGVQIIEGVTRTLTCPIGAIRD